MVRIFYTYTTMVTDKLKTLAITKARVAELEKSIAAELNRELAALPAKFGFADAQSFLDAVKAATRGRAGRAKKGTAPRRKRAVITADTKNKVKALVEAGKTGSEIAKSVGISLPSVQNIKKALGLVKARK
jgi:hypothetical protein